jgi:hypothetical protein
MNIVDDFAGMALLKHQLFFTEIFPDEQRGEKINFLSFKGDMFFDVGEDARVIHVNSIGWRIKITVLKGIRD